MVPFNFVGPAYSGRSTNYSAQKLINLYLETGKGKSNLQLIGSPGLSTPLVELGDPIRGCKRISDDVSVVVSGSTVYRVNSDFTTAVRGFISDDSRPVRIATNGIDVVVASAGNLYAITDAGSVFLRTASSVDEMDGIFLITEPGTGNFFVSDVNSTTIDALSFSVANGSPDNLVTLLVDHREVWLFGTNTIEVWYNSGVGVPPFARISGAFIETGCAAKDSVQKLANTVFWLGSDERGKGTVWSAQGYVPKKISDHAIEYHIGQWTTLDDAEAFVYTQEGHGFYVLTSPSSKQTWAFDVTTGEWHQRAYLEANGDLNRIRPRAHMFFANKNIVGDWTNGNLYEYSLNTYSDNGNPLPRIRSCMTLQEPGMLRQRNKSFRLDMDTGVGLTTGQGSDPQAMLRWSKDGGKTWSASIWRSMGKIGHYGWRTMWRRIGGGDRTVLEVTITDPIPVAMTGAVYG
jgi:hypothetical protein